MSSSPPAPLHHAISRPAHSANVLSLRHTEPSSTLGTLLRSAIPLPPRARADLLYNSAALEAAHQSSAQQGDTAAPPAEDLVELHYVAFVVGSDGKLWELDGRRKGPIERGAVPAGEDVLGEVALEAGPRRFLRREVEGGEMRFSIVALGPSLD